MDTDDLSWAQQQWGDCRLGDRRLTARALAYGDVSVRTIANMLRTGIADLSSDAAEPAPDWPQPRYAREANDLVPAHLKG